MTFKGYPPQPDKTKATGSGLDGISGKMTETPRRRAESKERKRESIGRMSAQSMAMLMKSQSLSPSAGSIAVL
jgi:hypothetical protein